MKLYASENKYSVRQQKHVEVFTTYTNDPTSLHSPPSNFELVPEFTKETLTIGMVINKNKKQNFTVYNQIVLKH